MNDRPEDIANRRYYNHDMLTRRARIVVELDVEWRADDPDYALSVVQTDALDGMTSVRLLHPLLVSAELLPDAPKRVDD